MFKQVNSLLLTKSYFVFNFFCCYFDLKKYSIFDDSRKLIPAKNYQTSHPRKVIPTKCNFFRKKNYREN